tara:strand:+ start:3215 stop:3535 length:321 start_codon:yes stop_codon:yes gene_type:complete
MKKGELLKEVLDNIRVDRTTTETLLQDLLVEIKSNETTNARSGLVAAKYVETLQRSNEQIVKILTLMQKAARHEEDLELSDNEKDNIFELIKDDKDDKDQKRATGE